MTNFATGNFAVRQSKNVKKSIGKGLAKKSLLCYNIIVMTQMDEILEKLNDEQIKPVLQTEGGQTTTSV